MKKIIFDVAASESGAVTILKTFYDSAILDVNTEYIFVLGIIKLDNADNIKVINYSWIKKSWIHRIIFDIFFANRIVKKNKCDEIISLQNVVIPFCKKKQTVYMHNSLHFCSVKFNIISQTKLWIYQNIIGKMIKKSLKKADHIIVQTNWIKNACVTKWKIDSNKICVEKPKIIFSLVNKQSKKNTIETLFFYPATPYIYKNHKVIIDACVIINNQGIKNYRVVFTCNGNENKHIAKIKKKVIQEKIPVDFVGNITKDNIGNYYNNSCLLFPSYLETLGLPLLEAKLFNCEIITTTESFSIEIMGKYEKCHFFKYDDSKRLAEIMLELIKR